MNKPILTTLLTAGLIAFGSAQAAILAGDTIVIDFTKNGAGTTGISGETWNNIQEADNGTDGWGAGGIETVVIASNLVRISDGAATGVGITYDGLAAGSNSGIGGLSVGADDASAIFAVSGLIPTAAQGDVTFQVNGETQYTFTGLDDSLTYNFSFQSWTSTTARNATDWRINPGLASESTLTIDPNDSPSVYTFSNVATDGSGNIILRSLNTSGGANNGHINAMEITAIPEPSTFALFGLAGLAAVFVARRR